MPETKTTAFPNEKSLLLIPNTAAESSSSSEQHSYPGNQPGSAVVVVWTVINAILCVWSLLLLYQILWTSQSPTDRLYGERLYLIWNFGTTLVWCLEVGWTMRIKSQDNNDDNRNRRQDGRAASAAATTTWSWCPSLDCIQLLIAIYFLLDSLHLLIKWKVKGDIDEELFDVIISSVAYLGQLVHTGRSWYRGQKEEEEEVDSVYV